MSKTFAIREVTRKRSIRQAAALVLSGSFFLLGAWLLHPNPYAYPAGVFLFGLGILIAALLYPYRLLTSGILMTLVGASVYIAFARLIPYGGSTLIIAIGLGLLGIALAARRGYIGKGAVTPGIIVLAVGLIEYPPATHLLPGSYIPFLLSLWFPGLSLLILGIIYWFIGGKK
jgi:hypothetical protein